MNKPVESAAATLTGAEAVVEMLKAHGVEVIFGLCGDTSLPLYDALARLPHGMRHVLTRDQRHAAYMADGYARVEAGSVFTVDASVVVRAKAQKCAKFDALACSDDRPIEQGRVVKALSKALDADAIIVVDPGTSLPYLSALVCQPLREARALVPERLA